MEHRCLHARRLVCPASPLSLPTLHRRRGATQSKPPMPMALTLRRPGPLKWASSTTRVSIGASPRHTPDPATASCESWGLCRFEWSFSKRVSWPERHGHFLRSDAFDEAWHDTQTAANVFTRLCTGFAPFIDQTVSLLQEPKRGAATSGHRPCRLANTRHAFFGARPATPAFRIPASISSTLPWHGLGSA